MNKVRAESEYYPKTIFDRKHHAVDDSGKRAFSEIFYIAPGEAAVLSLYGAPSVLNGKITTDPTTGKKYIESESCFVLHKLSFGQSDPLRKKLHCGDRINIQDEYDRMWASRTVRFEPVRKCGELWTMSGCDNYALLNIPGYYMFEVGDAELFDTAYIEMVKVSTFDVASVPDAFKFGS